MGAPSIPTPPPPPPPPPEREEKADFSVEDENRKKNQGTVTGMRVRTDAAGAGTNVPGQ